MNTNFAVTLDGSQETFSKPTLSSFHLLCLRELEVWIINIVSRKGDLSPWKWIPNGYTYVHSKCTIGIKCKKQLVQIVTAFKGKKQHSSLTINKVLSRRFLSPSWLKKNMSGIDIWLQKNRYINSSMLFEGGADYLDLSSNEEKFNQCRPHMAFYHIVGLKQQIIPKLSIGQQHESKNLLFKWFSVHGNTRGSKEWVQAELGSLL